VDGHELHTPQEVRIGRVVSVSGSQVVILLENGSGNGAAPPLEIGALVKLHTPESTVFGMVGGLSIPIPAQNAGESEMKIVELELLGEALNGEDGAEATFQRGVSAFPALGDGVFTTTQEDLSRVYVRPGVSAVRIGTIHQDQSLPAYIFPDDLLGKHMAVLGTTGSGKSCAVALILRAILGHHPNAHIVLLDPHNEYARAFGESAEVLSPGSLELPFWLFNSEEIVEVLLDLEAKSGPEATILNELIPVAKLDFLEGGGEEMHVTVDTPVPYYMSKLVRLIEDAMGKLEKPENLAPYLRLKARLNAIQTDSRFAFMFGNTAAHDNMAELLSRIFRVPVAGKPVTIVDLSGVPSEILNVVVSVLCRITFDFALWSDRAVPIMLVCEEAHRYAPNNPALGFEPTKRALSRIAKEGRKYGVSLCVVSQRPSELATEILSQCNTIFALRMSNQKDQEFVRAALSEWALGLLDFLPSLRNAEAIAVGEGVAVPMRLCFDVLPEENRPRSGAASFSDAWQKDCNSENFIHEVVARWRRQGR
jgi:hypothetical protein